MKIQCANKSRQQCTVTIKLLVVGETVLKLDDRSKMGQLEKNVKVVEKKLNRPVVPLLITHFAHPQIFRKANEQGILVIQSFEW